MSRSPCRSVVDTYWHLCGQPFFLPVSHILLKVLGLPPVLGLPSVCVYQYMFESRGQYCGSGILCLFDPWIRDPGWVTSQDPDPG